MSEDDFDLMDCIRVNPALLSHLGRVIEPSAIQAISQADHLIQQARLQAAVLLDQAQARIDIEYEATQAKQAQEFTDLLLRQAQHVEALQKSFQTNFETRINGLMADVLRRMDLDLSTTAAVQAAARTFVAQFSHLDSPALQMHPQDLQAFQADDSFSLPASWTVQADPSLEPGSCRLRTGQGAVNCNVSQLLNRLAIWLETCPPMGAGHATSGT